MNTLLKAVSQLDIETVEKLLLDGADANFTDSSCRTPLMELADPSYRPPDSKSEQLAHLLISHGANINEVNKFGLSIMWHAVRNGNIYVVNALKSNGLKILDTISLNEFLDKLWPRHPARSQREPYRQTLIGLLDENPDLSAVNSRGLTTLCIACKEGNSVAISLLLQAGANPNTPSSQGSTALEFFTNYAWRARCEGLTTINQLLEYGANPNNTGHESTINDTKSALLWTLYCGGNTESVVEALLIAGADPNTTDHLGVTPLEYAVRTKNIGLIELIKRYQERN